MGVGARAMEALAGSPAGGKGSEIPTQTGVLNAV